MHELTATDQFLQPTQLLRHILRAAARPARGRVRERRVCTLPFRLFFRAAARPGRGRVRARMISEGGSAPPFRPIYDTYLYLFLAQHADRSVKVW